MHFTDITVFSTSKSMEVSWFEDEYIAFIALFSFALYTENEVLSLYWIAVLP